APGALPAQSGRDRLRRGPRGLARSRRATSVSPDRRPSASWAGKTWGDLRAHIHVQRVLHNTDGLDRVFRRFVPADSLPDGILIREVFSRERLVYDGDHGRPSDILWSNLASQHRRNAHRIEITGADAVPRRIGLLVLFGRVTCDAHRAAPVVPS